MIVTSHHMEEIDQFCVRIALIDHGRMAYVAFKEVVEHLGFDGVPSGIVAVFLTIALAY